ncbi:MAG: FCD domain-containing protein [Clostridiales bacterium]|nr:FCD domain-containing protein [Clostridiales bacterium]
MRAGYETMAVKLLDGKLPEETIGRMEDILEKMKELDVEHFENIFIYDDALHGELVKMVHLPRLYKAWEQLSYGNIISGYGQELDRNLVTSRQYLLHKDLVAACHTGDAHVICKRISDHYMKSITWLLEEQGISEEESGYSLDFLL